jgi:hypothetical protein
MKSSSSFLPIVILAAQVKAVLQELHDSPQGLQAGVFAYQTAVEPCLR